MNVNVGGDADETKDTPVPTRRTSHTTSNTKQQVQGADYYVKKAQMQRLASARRTSESNIAVNVNVNDTGNVSNQKSVDGNSIADSESVPPDDDGDEPPPPDDDDDEPPPPDDDDDEEPPPDDEDFEEEDSVKNQNALFPRVAPQEPPPASDFLSQIRNNPNKLLNKTPLRSFDLTDPKKDAAAAAKPTMQSSLMSDIKGGLSKLKKVSDEELQQQQFDHKKTAVEEVSS